MAELRVICAIAGDRGTLSCLLPHGLILIGWNQSQRVLENNVKVGNRERSKSQMLRFTKFKALLCVRCPCGLQVCQFILVKGILCVCGTSQNEHTK